MNWLSSALRSPRLLLLLAGVVIGVITLLPERTGSARTAAVVPDFRSRLHGSQAVAPRAAEAAFEKVGDESVPAPPQPRSITHGARVPSHARIRQPASLPHRRPSPASRQAQESGVNSASSDAEIIFELAPGMLAPAAVATTHEALPLNPAQETLKEKIADEFAREIEGALADPITTSKALGETWSHAQKRADERFRLMFGNAAFVKQSAAAAREAMQAR